MKSSHTRHVLVATLGLFLLAGPAVPPTGAADVPSSAEPTLTASIRSGHEVRREDLPSLARVSFIDALHRALAAVPGSVINGELEIEDGNLMYSFEIVTVDKEIKEVEIDAGNGHILDIDMD